jgi:hypothetical protein
MRLLFGVWRVLHMIIPQSNHESLWPWDAPGCSEVAIVANMYRLHTQKVIVHISPALAVKSTVRRQNGPGRNLLVFPNPNSKGVPLDS